MESNNTQTKGQTMKADCPKCNGTGHIEAFSGIANGDCFMCNATGKVEVGTPAQKAELSAETRKRCEWIMNSTPESYAKVSWRQINAIRKCAHGGWGIQEAYPELLAHYREVGEPKFQAMQEEKLAAWYAANPV